MIHSLRAIVPPPSARLSPDAFSVCSEGNDSSSLPNSLRSVSFLLRLPPSGHWRPASRHHDLDVLRFGPFGLGKVDLEDAFLELGEQLRRFGVLGDGEAPGEGPVEPLDPVQLLPLLLLHPDSLARDREDVLVDG